MTKIPDAHGNDTKLTYVPAGCASCGGGGEKLRSLEDPLHSITSFDYSYDDVHKLYVSTATDPLQKTTTSTYDAVTRRQVVTDRNGHQVTYAHSPTGKLAGITYPGGAQGTFTCDDRDWLQQMQDSLGQTDYAYDNEGRITDYTDANGFHLHYSYFPGGNLEQITYPDSSRVTYTYYDDNRLQHVRFWLDETTYEEATYIYDAAGRPEAFTHFNGIICSALGRAKLSGRSHKDTCDASLRKYLNLQERHIIFGLVLAALRQALL